MDDETTSETFNICNLQIKISKQLLKNPGKSLLKLQKKAMAGRMGISWIESLG